MNFKELGIAVVVQLKIKTKFSCIPDSVVNHIGHKVCQNSKMVESSRKRAEGVRNHVLLVSFENGRNGRSYMVELWS